MKTMMLFLIMVSVGWAQVPVTVEVIPGGSYYHRPGHLLIEHDTVSVTSARAEGFAPCLECEPHKPYLTTYFKAVLRDRVRPIGDGIVRGEVLSLEGLAKLEERIKRKAPETTVNVHQGGAAR